MMHERQICNALSLYGNYNEQDYFQLKEWYMFINSFIEKLGYQFSYIGVDGEEIDETLAEGYVKISDDLTLPDFHELSSLSLCVTPEGSDAPAFDWVISVYNSYDKSYKYDYDRFFCQHHISICFDKSILSQESPLFKELLIQSLAFGDFYYGIVYERSFDEQPDLYSKGVTKIRFEFDDLTQELNDLLITEWSSFEVLAKEGYLRDIYSVNLLSKNHLTKSINGMSLQQWVTSEKQGVLTPVSGNLWMWSITNKDQVRRIRNYLGLHGLVICDPRFARHSGGFLDFKDEHLQNWNHLVFEWWLSDSH